MQLCFRRCAAVKHIPDVAKGVHENQSFKRIPDKLTELRNALNKVSDVKQKQLLNLEISNEKVLGQIQTMRRDVNKAFDDLEAHTIAELDKMKSSKEKQVQADVGVIRDNMDHVQKMVDDINEGKHNGESSAFIGFKKCEEILKQGQSTLRTMEMTTEVQLAFQPYTGLLDYLSTLTKLGELSCTGGSASSLTEVDDNRGQRGYKKVDTVPVLQHEHRGSCCRIIGRQTYHCDKTEVNQSF